MKKLMLFFALVSLFSCKKEADKPKCYTCTTVTKTYSEPASPNHQETGLPYESCTDVSGEKTTRGINYTVIRSTKCIQDK